MSQRGTAKTSLTHLPAGEDGAWDPTPRGIFALYIPSPLSIREAVRHVPYARLPPACGHDRRPPSSFFPRASPVPLAAVIPAPVAYIKVVAVKKSRSWISLSAGATLPGDRAGHLSALLRGRTPVALKGRDP